MSQIPPSRQFPVPVVTTSWDDGDPQDLRVAEMLEARGLPGTFYIPMTGHRGGPTLDRNCLRGLLARGFEIGAHGRSHQPLPRLCDTDLTREVQTCKPWLQDMLGEDVRMFCYIKGRYNARVVREVIRAGYEGARTTEMLGWQLDTDPYRLSTTLHAYPHAPAAYLRNMGRGWHGGRLLDWTIHYRGLKTWVELATRTFDRVIQRGGIWHLYGHSWLIEQHNLWNELGSVLDYVSRQSSVAYLTNGDLARAGRRFGSLHLHLAERGGR